MRNREIGTKGETNVSPIPIPNKIKTTNMVYIRKHQYVNMQTGDITEKLEPGQKITISKTTKTIKYATWRTITTLTHYYSDSRQIAIKF